MAKISELLKTDGNLNYIKTNKYKDITISIKCAYKYNRKLKASLVMLSNLMQDTSEKYPTKESMAKVKDMLYGLSYDCITSNVANLLTYTINYNFTNPRFFNDVSEKDYIDFIEETINHPYFNEKEFLECKRNIIDGLNRKLDKPSAYATSAFYKEVAKEDKDFDIYTDLTKEDIEILTLKDIKETFKELLNSRVDVYLVGDYTDELFNYLKKYKSKKELYGDVAPLKLSSNKEIDEPKEVGQSALIVSYSTPYTRKSNDYYAFNLGNILFGGIPSSLLFSEVREKDNLCYLIYSRAFRYDGLVYVSTLIDSKNKDKALEDIRKQFKRIVDKDYDCSLLDTAKKMLISNSLTIDDDLDYLITYHYDGHLCNTYITIDDYSKEIEKVTVEDVSRVFADYREYLTYFLEGIRHA